MTGPLGPTDAALAQRGLRSRAAACGRNRRGGAGAAVQICKRAATRAAYLGNGNPEGEGSLSPLLLRLADFRGAGRCPLAKTGALRQTQLPVSSAGRGRCVCLLRLADFRGAGRCPLAKTGALRQTQLPVSSAGRGRCVCLLRLADFRGAGRCPLAKTGALRQTQLPVSSAGRGRCVCLLRLANFPCGPQSALAKIGALRQARLAASSTGRASACLPKKCDTLPGPLKPPTR